TFTNLKQNSIVVEQQTRGGDGTFAFTSPQLSSFGLTTRSGVASQAFAALSTGLYTISQTLPSGWTLVSATCDNGDPPDRINLESGQSVKCTFVGQFQGVSSSDIPTLSEWGLLLLGALLAFGAWWQERIRTATGYREGASNTQRGSFCLQTEPRRFEPRSFRYDHVPVPPNRT
ncbi:MAG TPA: IPTL-CTERM sorting domain-containing protein, partial [Candidatus Competibacter sp.]|nr:IPTL-CTERM sorting domain-containing protein [Candidatus Competibacter sp.]